MAYLSFKIVENSITIALQKQSTMSSKTFKFGEVTSVETIEELANVIEQMPENSKIRIYYSIITELSEELSEDIT